MSTILAKDGNGTHTLVLNNKKQVTLRVRLYNVVYCHGNLL
jgi:hypothetical protein